MTLNEVSGCYKWGLWSCEIVGPRNPKTHMDEHYKHSGLLAAAPDKIHAQVRGVEKGPSLAPSHRHILQGCACSATH